MQANLATDSVQPAAPAGYFVHAPRPPGIPGSIPDKRDYLNLTRPSGPSNFLHAVGSQDLMPVTLVVTLQRYSPRKLATLRISTEDFSMDAGASLTPAALHELARMCIDAAHDIEAKP